MADKTLTGIITWLKNWFYDKTEIDSELSKKKSHYYGTCTTSASTQVKAVTSTDFVLNTGVVLSVKFTNNNTYNGTAKLKINDSEDEINVAVVGTTTTSRYYWKAGEVVTFVYDGTNFIMAEGGNATTTYYGVTKLSSSTSSTSEALSATPKAVKAAYDLANGKLSSSDVGAVAISNSYADLDNKPTIPSNVSDLNNDSGYITSSAITGMLTSSDIADNLTTNDSTKVLSAKQGKALADLIGNAITYINQ